MTFPIFDNKSRTRIYIAGPITGKPNGNKEAFSAMEDRLFDLGFQPVNPRRIAWPAYLDLNNEDDLHLGHQLMMREAVHQLSTCEAVVFLEGWDNSKGAKEEFDLAQALGQPCFDNNLQKLKPIKIGNRKYISTH